MLENLQHFFDVTVLKQLIDVQKSVRHGAVRVRGLKNRLESTPDL